MVSNEIFQLLPPNSGIIFNMYSIQTVSKVKSIDRLTQVLVEDRAKTHGAWIASQNPDLSLSPCLCLPLSQKVISPFC